MSASVLWIHGAVDPSRGVEGEREVVADLAREADALALGEEVAGQGAVDQHDRARRDRRATEIACPPPRSVADAAASRSRARAAALASCAGRGRVLARVQDDDDQRVAARSPRHRAERVEEALPLAVGRHDEDVPEVARPAASAAGGLGLGVAGEVLRDGPGRDHGAPTIGQAPQ